MQQAQQLGRYHLLDRVAFGGMAEIFRAKTADAQGRLHLVAVKRVLAHLGEDDEFIQMLIDEARLTAMLKHPNIARVYEFCRTPQEYFISMEYVDGKDLRAVLEKARQNQEWLGEDLVAYICMHVARGLHAAHIQKDREGRPLKIVHRDVSPSNVLLSYAGEVKLCDFGIAKASMSSSQTKTGIIKGKVKYMSPEQAMGRNKLDCRSDIFSLGSLLYEMLALQAPFSAGTEIELLFAVRDARKRPIREIRSHLNPHLEVIIERAMNKSRSQRFQAAEEFATSLQDFLDTNYPNYGSVQLGRHLQKTFERERERELRTLDEFVIAGGSAEGVGENLLADVLGPDAEYTQFTAAFSQPTPGLVDLSMSGILLENAPNPMQQMRSLAVVPMPGIDESDGFDNWTTTEKPRFSAADLDLGGSDEQATKILFKDSLHAQETAILSRQQVDAFIAERQSAVAPPAPHSLADEPELHEASTQILSMKSLPQDLREVLQGRAQRPSAAAQAEPATVPAERLPAVILNLPDGDLHEAQTAYIHLNQPAAVPKSESGKTEPTPAPPVRPPSAPALGAVAAPSRSVEAAAVPSVCSVEAAAVPAALVVAADTATPELPDATPLQAPSLLDDWEDLPHLDSTMISLGSSQHADRAAAPVRPAAVVTDQGDLPTVPPQPSIFDVEDDGQNTIANIAHSITAPAGQFDELPTPQKLPPALRDLGIDAHADFDEDTNKGGLPRGLNPSAHNVDAAQFLSDDDLEPID